MSVMENIRPMEIVADGGGAGLSNMADGLPAALSAYGIPFRLKAIFAATDNGGSTQHIRRETGYIAVGDGARTLIAMNPDPAIKSVGNYRYDESESGARDNTDTLRFDCARFYNRITTINPVVNDRRLGEILDETVAFSKVLGGVDGHTFRNLFATAAITKNGGNAELGFLEAGSLLGNQGTVVPVTNDSVELFARDGNQVIPGQDKISLHRFNNPHSTEVWTESGASVTSSAKEAFENADIILFAPGSRRDSLFATLCIDGVVDSIARSRAITAALTNLHNEDKQTRGWKLSHHKDTLEDRLGSKHLNYVLGHNAAKYPLSRLPKGATPIEIDINTSGLILDDFLDRQKHGDYHASDKLAGMRTDLFHNNAPTARAIANTIIPAHFPQYQLINA